MTKAILIFFNLNLMFAFANEINHYDFIPSKVADGFQFTHIAKLDSLNIIAGGGILISPLPDYIANIGIFKSTDGGNSWNNIYLDSNQLFPNEERFHFGLSNLEYLTESRILIFYENGFIRSTNDGGESWVLDSLGMNRRVLDLEFIDDKNGLILWNIDIPNLPDEKILLSTSNSGESWNEIVIPVDSLFKDEIYLNISSFNLNSEHEIFINTSILEFKNDSIYDYEVYQLLTSDLGSTWKKKLLLKEDNVNSRDQKSQQYISSTFQFLSKEIGYWIGATPSQTKEDISGNAWHYPFLKKTTDGGESWQTLFHDKDSSSRSRTALDIIDKQENDNLILKGNPSGILLYNNGESFFRSVFTRNFSALNKEYGYKSITDFLRLDSDRIMVAASSEYIFFIDYKNPITSVEDLSSQFELEIYPNPVSRSKSINLKFDPTILGTATISIFDINGRVVSSSEVNLSSPNEILEFKQGNDLPPGVYFLQIGHSNGLAERQKFVVE